MFQCDLCPKNIPKNLACSSYCNIFPPVCHRVKLQTKFWGCILGAKLNTATISPLCVILWCCNPGFWGPFQGTADYNDLFLMRSSETEWALPQDFPQNFVCSFTRSLEKIAMWPVPKELPQKNSLAALHEDTQGKKRCSVSLAPRMSHKASQDLTQGRKHCNESCA